MSVSSKSVCGRLLPGFCQQGSGRQPFAKAPAKYPFPKCDEKALVKQTAEIAVQINGKVRGRVEIPADLTRENAEAYFAGNAEVQRLLGGKAVRKLIFVPGRLVNIVCG